MTFAVRTSAGDPRATLSAAAATLRIQPEPQQLQRLVAYVELLQRWNAVHNLSSTNDAMALTQHVVDCLAIVRPLTERSGSAGVHALDAGTGGGLPAVVLSVMLPDWTVTAVDAVGKKIAFVRQVAGELGLRNLRPMHARLERAKRDGAGSNVIVSRAFSSLRQFVEQTRHLLAPGGHWVAMKGKLPESEIRDLPTNCQLFHVERLTVPGLDADRCLVWVQPRAPTSGGQ
jgi:16S rRNA (guanine527-N7)-methyltransferase